MRRNSLVAAIALGSLIVLTIFVVHIAAAGPYGATVRISVAPDGSQGNSYSGYPSVSADGRWVAFASNASNLIPGDTNYSEDVFLADRLNGEITLISRAADGGLADANSGMPSISGDGRYVVFFSGATNLVAGLSIGPIRNHIYLLDRQTGQTVLVDHTPDGSPGDNIAHYNPVISADGRWVAFNSGAMDLLPGRTVFPWHVYVYEVQTGEITRVSLRTDGSEGDACSWSPSISADGQYVAFWSYAHLGPDNPGFIGDVFVHDRLTHETTLVSVASDGTPGNGDSFTYGLDGNYYAPCISADGRYVGFGSWANNLVPDDNNGKSDMFVHDRQTGVTTLVSANTAGGVGNGNSGGQCSWSADGRYITFRSSATDLVSPDTNGQSAIFVRDMWTGQTRLVSVPNDGSQANGPSDHPAMSADGRYVVYQSPASNLVDGDTDNLQDVFVYGVAPVVDVGGDGTSNEGDAFVRAGSFTGAWAGGWDATVNYGDGSGVQPLPLNPDKTFTLNHTYADNGVYTVEVCVADGASIGCNSSTVTVLNVAPTVGQIIAPLDPVQVGIVVDTGAGFTDPGVLDTHMALWEWGDGSTSAGAVNETLGSGTAAGSHTYTAPGVYTIKVTVMDKDGGSGYSMFQYIVVYDPEGGFVTGSGWINSPQGAYALDPSTTGRAHFGFVSRYQRGAKTPTGQTQFRFQASSLSFESEMYQWLVIAGHRAQFKGTGTINGVGNYGFLLTAIDGQINGGGGVDKFRIKIWDKESGDTVVYDNQMSAEDGADPTTVIGGGSIVIHKQ